MSVAMKPGTHAKRERGLIQTQNPRDRFLITDELPCIVCMYHIRPLKAEHLASRIACNCTAQTSEGIPL